MRTALCRGRRELRGACLCVEPREAWERDEHDADAGNAGEAATDTMRRVACVSAATVPDSMSPRRTPPVTTRPKTELIRPRIASVVTSCAIVVAADGADAVGAAGDGEQHRGEHDARRRARDAAIAAPQISTIAIVIRPSRRARVSQPLVTAAIAAPKDTAA